MPTPKHGRTNPRSPSSGSPGEEDEEKKVGWRLVETYLRESKIPAELRPDAVEVPVEADRREHGLPTLTGVFDLVQAGISADYKTSGQTPNPERTVHRRPRLCAISRVTRALRRAGSTACGSVHARRRVSRPSALFSFSSRRRWLCGSRHGT